jgi:hypothetical protein
LPCTSLTRYEPSMLWVVCLFTVITLYTSCIGTARRLRCICHSYHIMNNILNIFRIQNPTTHKLPTHTWHGSLFLLFLQLAIQKIFYFCFLPYILTLTVRIPMRMMQWYFEHFRMSPEGLPGSGFTSWVNIKSFTHYRRWTFCPIFMLLGLHDPFYSPRLWWTWDGAINKVGGRWHGQSMQAISSKGLLTKPSGPCRH